MSVFNVVDFLQDSFASRRLRCLLAWAAGGTVFAAGPGSHRFDFGGGEAAPGYTQVAPTALYTAERGFGFEPGFILASFEREGANPLTNDFKGYDPAHPDPVESFAMASSPRRPMDTPRGN